MNSAWKYIGVACASVALIATAGCSTGGDKSSDKASNDVVLLTHDSYAVPKELVKEFEKENNIKLVHRAVGDAGSLTNRLVLTKDDPTGDVVFGVDNTFASRALDEGVFASNDVTLPLGAEGYLITGAEKKLAPINTASVCVNIDKTWFADKKLAEPKTLEDLTDVKYRDLFVAPSATTSSPGLAFMLTTTAAFGDDWPQYWERLMANGAKLTSGWSDAYYVEFTQGGEKGKRPIVLSYDTSPAFTLNDEGTESTTAALLDTCFRQVEYAGVLKGAKNPEGAAKVIEFLLSEEVQAAIPDSMYVFGVRDDVELPEAWAKFAVQPTKTFDVTPDEIAKNRSDWLKTWTDVTSK
ncbi:MAG: thiamine ABC transporter substrate-binding protein [Aeromicrobium sp.]|nr:MAG: thiamine ABC transporter substrate-binding protein [Aeromicrobium sp.]